MYSKILSCMQILDIVCHVYLFSMPTSILNTFFLCYTKSTTTLIADMHCINHMFLVSSYTLLSFDPHLVHVTIFILLEIRKKKWTVLLYDSPINFTLYEQINLVSNIKDTEIFFIRIIVNEFES